MNEPLENLMAKARRRELRADERRRLEQGLNASLEAALLYQAGRSFDEEVVVQTGDETFIEGVATQAARRFGRVEARSRARVSALAVAVGSISSLAAAGILVVAVRASHPATSVAANHAATQARASTNPATSRFIQPLHVPSVEPSSAQAVTGELTPGLARAAIPATPDVKHELTPPVTRADARSSLPALPTAPSLFQSANKSRSEGSIVAAVADYERLQREFPRSREAELATMSLGLIELQRGNPRMALAHFRRARLTQPSPEALWGEAKALHQLGNTADEHRVLDELLRHYPGSAYDAAARKRLEAQD
jgi:TolA-binding protein